MSHTLLSDTHGRPIHTQCPGRDIRISNQFLITRSLHSLQGLKRLRPLNYTLQPNVIGTLV